MYDLYIKSLWFLQSNVTTKQLPLYFLIFSDEIFFLSLLDFLCRQSYLIQLLTDLSIQSREEKKTGDT